MAEKKFGRRWFVTGAAAAVTAACISNPTGVSAILRGLTDKLSHNSSLRIPEGGLPGSKREIVESPTTEFIRSSANQFMGLEPADREGPEMDMWNQLGNINFGEMSYALWASGSRVARLHGIERMHHLRQLGDLEQFGFASLGQDEVNWGEDYGIHPATLAFARDAQRAAIELVQAKPDLFFQSPADVTADEMALSVPNAGHIARLSTTESSGLVFIGGADAWDEINTDVLPQDRGALEEVAQHHSLRFALPYLDHVRKIPGSENPRNSDNVSGGAIGPQMLPHNATDYINRYQLANEALGNRYDDPNLFDPFTAHVLMALYLVANGNRDGDIDRMRAAQSSWNALGSQIDDVVGAAESYRGIFLS